MYLYDISLFVVPVSWDVGAILHVCALVHVSDATVGQVVKRMEATDPDLGASLVYYLEEPKQAWDTHGQEVAPSTYEFRVGGPLLCNNCHYEWFCFSCDIFVKLQ